MIGLAVIRGDNCSEVIGSKATVVNRDAGICGRPVRYVFA